MSYFYYFLLVLCLLSTNSLFEQESPQRQSQTWDQVSDKSQIETFHESRFFLDFSQIWDQNLRFETWDLSWIWPQMYMKSHCQKFYKQHINVKENRKHPGPQFMAQFLFYLCMCVCTSGVLSGYTCPHISIVSLSHTDCSYVHIFVA